MNITQSFLMILALALAPLARGQTLEVLHSFNGADGSEPVGELLQGNDGSIYGTTSTGGGLNTVGTVFKLTGGVLTTISTMSSTNGFAEGIMPESGLIQDNDGNLYGTTTYGGATNLQLGGGTVSR